MIQAPLQKPIELPKAQPKRADAEVVSNQKQTQKASKKNEVSSKEVNEFDKELDAASTESEVKAVKVAEDLEMPSKLVNPNGSFETTSPKILRPLITGREYFTSTDDKEKSCLMLCAGLGEGILMP